ncbi:MAG: SPASM domain-containing protein, partial [Bryobacteraceae bacterium]
INEFGNWAGARNTETILPFDAKWLTPQAATQLEEGGPCGYPIYHVKVMVNGDVKFCSCVDFDNATENTIGNVRDASLKSIYNGERARGLWREGLSMCVGCTHRKPLSELDALYPFFAEPIKGLGV